MKQLSTNQMKDCIVAGEAALGIEFGSTRIKAVLIEEFGTTLASGSHSWENHLENGIWTYPLDEALDGLANAYADLAADVEKKYGTSITSLKSIGISGMMHGYLPFDRVGNQLAEFRTWRNNITGQSAKALSELFSYNIPQRWSVAHLYQAILNGEENIDQIDFMTTLAGYIHWKLSGKKVLGIDEASGMFPIDTATHTYNKHMLAQFDNLVANKNYPWKLEDILPEVLVAGKDAGSLTEQGAALLDRSGKLKAGALMCPPEGDAGTGMMATNSIKPCTANVSAGTSVFAMVVLDRELSRMYESLDMVTTPAGDLVAMAHSNNCSTEIDAWMKVFAQVLNACGADVDVNALYKALFQTALEGDKDCGKVLAYCFHSGEHGVGLTQGCPALFHPSTANFNLSNFMRAQLCTCFGAMKLGFDILMKQEHIPVKTVLAHGGLFKTKKVAQSILAAAVGTTVEVKETAGEGGAWGIALLASYRAKIVAGKSLDDYSLADYLDEVFASDDESASVTYTPSQEEIDGFEVFMQSYKDGLAAEKEAIAALVHDVE